MEPTVAGLSWRVLLLGEGAAATPGFDSESRHVQAPQPRACGEPHSFSFDCGATMKCVRAQTSACARVLVWVLGVTQSNAGRDAELTHPVPLSTPSLLPLPLPLHQESMGFDSAGHEPVASARRRGHRGRGQCHSVLVYGLTDELQLAASDPSVAHADATACQSLRILSPHPA
jgi:hypothetical protein